VRETSQWRTEYLLPYQGPQNRGLTGTLWSRGRARFPLSHDPSKDRFKEVSSRGQFRRGSEDLVEAGSLAVVGVCLMPM